MIKQELNNTNHQLNRKVKEREKLVNDQNENKNSRKYKK